MLHILTYQKDLKSFLKVLQQRYCMVKSTNHYNNKSHTYTADMKGKPHATIPHVLGNKYISKVKLL